MPSTTRVRECAEAVCSALYSIEGFEFIGESENGRVSWFKRGTKPRAIRVSVARSDLGFVTVIPEWFNISLPGQSIHGQEPLNIRCETADEVTEGSYRATVRILEIYRDVLAGTGIASAKALDHLKFG